MYQLAAGRIASLERRAPLGAAALVALMAAFSSIPVEAQAPVLIAMSIGAFWYLETTINHARSFEDLIRRVDEIECSINKLAGQELLVFQSTHPSRGRRVGGRTGHETVQAVLCSSLVLLLVGLWLSYHLGAFSIVPARFYSLYVIILGSALSWRANRLGRYEYHGQS